MGRHHKGVSSVVESPDVLARSEEFHSVVKAEPAALGVKCFLQRTIAGYEQGIGADRPWLGLA